MPYAHVNGQRLYYEDTGGDGPAIVFSHGLLMDGSMFAPRVLRGAWRCIELGRARPRPDRHGYVRAVQLLRLGRRWWRCWRTWASGARCSLACRRAATCRCALRCATRRWCAGADRHQALPEEAEKMAGHQVIIQEWLERGLSDERARTIEHIILGDG